MQLFWKYDDDLSGVFVRHQPVVHVIHVGDGLYAIKKRDVKSGIELTMNNEPATAKGFKNPVAGGRARVRDLLADPRINTQFTIIDNHQNLGQLFAPA